jgi:membrane-bound lytic murein transglycosylase D
MQVKIFLYIGLLLGCVKSYALIPDGFIEKDPDKTFPQYPALVYEYYITELNKDTPVELAYNQHVQRYIDIFTLERRSQVEQFLGLSEFYFPVFEEYLLRYELPLELKYLAVVESGLNPFARSPSDAVGLWQFLYHTALMFDLQITSYIDERRDMYKSTDAACRYLKYLYRTFGDWNLALAAYNGGPGMVEKAIARSGGKTDFWQIYPYLTEAMRNYVPAFIAMNYVFRHHDKHQLTSVPCNHSFYDLDTLHINYKISFSGIGRKIDMDEDIIRQLNPCYKLDEIPGTDKPMVLVLPREKAVTFLEAENHILSARAEKNVLPETGQDRTCIIHSVQKGDFLHKLAIRYGCTVDDIRRWNKLPDKNLTAGTKLTIWIDN